MNKVIFHNKPTFDKKEEQAVCHVLRSGWVAQGKKVEAFENDLVKFQGQKGYAAAFSSGTAALYVAILSLGVKPGDEIILPSYACSSLLNAVFLAQAKPILVDINQDDLNISLAQTKEKISKRTKAIIITHTFGWPAQMKDFLKLNIPIIEDCAQAIGSEYQGKKVGNFGDIAIFSFYASKLLTTGNGGMVYTKKRNIINKVKDFRQFDCRKNYKPRFNLLMSDLQAAIGRVQLKKLPEFLRKRNLIATKYSKIFKQEIFKSILIDLKPNNYRCLLKTKKPLKLLKYLLKNRIHATVPIENYELLHNYLKLNNKQFPGAEYFSKNFISLPIYPTLKSDEVKKIISKINLFKDV